ncbi:helix-turn-helix transcriptional regulator [candidate division KSB1 bacterium]|nr:helix-turn-helix transcriptional regulator [candidate division KSB1 bacterium]
MPPEQDFLKKVLTVIEKRLGEERFNVTELSREISMSRTQLHRRLQALQQPSASALLRASRLRRGEMLLQKTGLSVTEVAYRCGFRSAAYFAQCFREDFGVTPSQFRDGAKSDLGKRIP